MIPILTPEQMQRADRHAIGRLGIPSLLLMENAGSAVAAELLRRRRFRGVRVAVLCGKGNNGGDGLVIARKLNEAGAAVTVVLISPVNAFSADALAMYRRLPELPVVPLRRFLSDGPAPSVIIDAMLGTSFTGRLRDAYREAVGRCNAMPGWKVAVDIPTGLNGTTGETEGAAFRADLTVTLSNPKYGFYRSAARDVTGDVVTADIGIPGESIERVSSGLFLVEADDIRRLLPRRRNDAHKGTAGKVFVLAGSRGMTGAALLAARSALRSGAGLVVLGVPASELPSVARRTLEAMPFPLPSTNRGAVSIEALPAVRTKLSWCDAAAVGCGLSVDPETRTVVRSLLGKRKKPMVLDADALNALSGRPSLLRGGRTTVITPHVAELARLTGTPAEEIERDPFGSASAVARRYGVTVVMKGGPTAVADPGGSVFVNPTGNPGMATAGSGDVLTGVIGALLGQGLSAGAAAVAGVYLHGAAGDRARSRRGVHGLIASDIIAALPAAIKEFDP